MTPDQFLHRCPALWHVAPAGAWDTIKEVGLRTAEQLIDAADLTDEARTELLDTPRAEAVTLKVDGTGVLLRDQAPLLKAKLSTTLADGVTEADWIRMVNRRAYLFADRAVLTKALEKYIAADGAQDVLTFSPRRLIDAARYQLELAVRNTTAAARRNDPTKGRDTFLSITRFPDRRPAEVTIVDGLDDLASVVRVERHHPDGTREPLT